MMWQWHNYGWSWYLAMPLVMLGFWALVAWAVVTLVRGDRSTAPGADAADAGRILAERYARGDIDTDEYHARLDVLRRSRVPGGGAR